MRRALLALAAAACHDSAPPRCDPPAAPPPMEHITGETRPIEHRVTCHGVTAIWTGENDGEYDRYNSLAFAIGGRTRMFARDLSDQREAQTFDIFSPDCRRVLLLQSRKGPYHVVRTDKLGRYLDGGAPEYVLAGEHDPTGITGTGVFRGGGWLSNTEVAYTWGCCDPPITTRAKLAPIAH